MSQEPRKTYKYIYKVGNKAKHFGITTDLSRREKEHSTKLSEGHIKKVGRRTTRLAARKWAQERRNSTI